MERLYCPKCHLPLIKGKDRRYETLSEHVSNPNIEDYPLRPSYICDNDDCPASKEDFFWDESGDFYGYNKDFEFHNDIYSAYPSISRKLDIEVYKKGLEKELNLPSFLMLGLLKPIIEYNYEADYYGNVLNKKWNLCFLKREKLFKGRFCYKYTFPLVYIYHDYLRTKRIIDSYKKSNNPQMLLNLIKPIPSWDKRWWRKTEHWLRKKMVKKYL